MKKITLFLGLLLATTFSFAQTNLTEAVDFTVTDVNGQRWEGASVNVYAVSGSPRRSRDSQVSEKKPG